MDHVHVFPLYGEEFSEWSNVTVKPIGRDQSESRVKKIIRLERYFADLLMKNSVDGLFVHQNHFYPVLLAWTRCFFQGPTVLFRAHGQLPWSIRLGLPFVDKVLTSTEGAFDYPTPKREVLSLPIDLEMFTPTSPPDSDTFKIVATGRISPIKGYELLIDATKILLAQDYNIEVEHYGAPAREEDKDYLKGLEDKLDKLNLNDHFHFRGKVPYERIPEVLSENHMLVNSPVERSALDQVVLEAMASSLVVLSTNPLYKPIFEGVSEKLYVPGENGEILADRIRFWIDRPSGRRQDVGKQLRQVIEDDFSLDYFADRLVSIYS